MHGFQLRCVEAVQAVFALFFHGHNSNSAKHAEVLGDRWLRNAEGETVEQTVSRVRGPEGEDVVLTIGRDGEDDLDVTITRREFDLPLVSWAMIPGTKLALIRLDQFASGATDAVKNALTEAKADGATGIVFDLRSNPGGYVGEAVGVASQFLSEGIVYQAINRGCITCLPHTTMLSARQAISRSRVFIRAPGANPSGTRGW